MRGLINLITASDTGWGVTLRRFGNATQQQVVALVEELARERHPGQAVHIVQVETLDGGAGIVAGGPRPDSSVERTEYRVLVGGEAVRRESPPGVPYAYRRVWTEYPGAAEAERLVVYSEREGYGQMTADDWRPSAGYLALAYRPA